MPFKVASKKGPQCEIYLKNDIASLLDALEIYAPRSGYELGFMEALTRVAAGVGLVHEPAQKERPYFLLESQDRAASRGR